MATRLSHPFGSWLGVAGGLVLLSCSSADPGPSTTGGGGTGGGQGGNPGTGGTPPAAQGGAGGTSAPSGGRSGTTGGSGGAAMQGGSGGSGGGGGSTTGGTGGAGVPERDAGAVDAGGGRGGSGGAAPAGGAGGAGGAAALPRFSFFTTSLEAMRRLSKNQMGFGGDLRYGTADGLTGADKICTEIAESSMPGSSVKQWRAFLSVSRGPDGMPVHAADRIGNGPWYDRLGRVVAMTKANLLQPRPVGADPAIKEDLPNESGTPNHRPDPTMPPVDNHHVLTGSDPMGRLYNAQGTCLDWTSSARDNMMTGRPRIGFSWSIQNRIHWISGQDEGGCGAGINLGDTGGSNPNNPIVGSGGGYGAIYCFALTP